MPMSRSLSLLYASLTFLSCTVISTASNEHPVGRGHRREAKSGSLCGPRITRNDEAMVSALLPCATLSFSEEVFINPLVRIPVIPATQSSAKRFRCQLGDCGYRVRRLCTGCYLLAHLRRILLMEQQVWSIRARQSTLRPRVATIIEQDFFS